MSWTSWGCCGEQVKSCFSRCNEIINANGRKTVWASDTALPNFTDTAANNIIFPDTDANGKDWSNSLTQVIDPFTDWDIRLDGGAADERRIIDGYVSLPQCTADGEPVTSVEVRSRKLAAWGHYELHLALDGNPANCVSQGKLARAAADTSAPVAVTECFYARFYAADDGANARGFMEWSINGAPYETVPNIYTDDAECTETERKDDWYCFEAGNPQGTGPDGLGDYQLADIEALTGIVSANCADIPDCYSKGFDIEWGAGVDPDCQSWSIGEVRADGSVVDPVDYSLTTVSEELGPDGEVIATVTYADGCELTKTFTNVVETAALNWAGTNPNTATLNTLAGQVNNFTPTTASVWGNATFTATTNDLTGVEMSFLTNEIVWMRYGTAASPNNVQFNGPANGPIPLENPNCTSGMTFDINVVEVQGMLPDDRAWIDVTWYDAGGNVVGVHANAWEVFDDFGNTQATGDCPKPAGAVSYTMDFYSDTQGSARQHRLYFATSTMSQY